MGINEIKGPGKKEKENTEDVILRKRTRFKSFPQ